VSLELAAIIAELITDAEPHGGTGGPTESFVSVGLEANQVVSRINNDSCTRSHFTPHLGSFLVDELAAEIDGRIERRFGKNGAAITLSFPMELDQATERQKFAHFS